MRPIDADALLAKWNEKAMKMVRDKDGAIPIDFSNVISALILEPTLDGLRPKGWWEPVDARYSRCTNCKRERNIRTQIGWEFCPSCGAKMEYGVADE